MCAHPATESATDMTPTDATAVAEVSPMNPNLSAANRWRYNAACRGMDPNLFLPETGTGKGAPEYSSARMVCAACPVQPECLEYAINAGEKYGMWGGLTPTERKRAGAKFRKTFNCRRCGNIAVRMNNGQLYCSDACRQDQRRLTRST